MKFLDWIILLLVIVLGATVANLIALYIAAQVAQRQLGGVAGNPTLSLLSGLFGPKKTA